MKPGPRQGQADHLAPPCTSCTGLNGVHYLTCRRLSLAPDWYLRSWDSPEDWLEGDPWQFPEGRT